MAGRDGTIVFTLRERTIVSMKTGADLISLSTVSIRQLMEGYLRRCAACVSLPYRLGVLKDFQEVNKKTPDKFNCFPVCSLLFLFLQDWHFCKYNNAGSRQRGTRNL